MTQGQCTGPAALLRLSSGQLRYIIVGLSWAEASTSTHTITTPHFVLYLYMYNNENGGDNQKVEVHLQPTHCNSFIIYCSRFSCCHLSVALLVSVLARYKCMELGADTMRRPLCNWVEDIYKAMTCVCARDFINLMTMLWCVIFLSLRMHVQ